MEIINPGKEDFHMHSLTYSDGTNTIDEIARYAGEIGVKKIAITDHSQEYLDKKGFYKKTYSILTNQRWKNIFNKTEVILGIEGDLLNRNGDISIDIQGQACSFNILSSHQGVYSDDETKITEAYMNAIEKHHNKIKFLGHPCIQSFSKHIDIEAVTEQANKYDLPMEFNCANLYYNKTDLDKLRIILRKCRRIYINSDSHTLFELKTFRKLGFKFLEDEGFIRKSFFRF